MTLIVQGRSIEPIASDTDRTIPLYDSIGRYLSVIKETILNLKSAQASPVGFNQPDNLN